MTRDEFATVLAEEGYPRQEEDRLWEACPYDPTVVDKEIFRLILRRMRPLFAIVYPEMNQ